jgi:hypothetical protein
MSASFPLYGCNITCLVPMMFTVFWPITSIALIGMLIISAFHIKKDSGKILLTSTIILIFWWASILI